MRKLTTSFPPALLQLQFWVVALTDFLRFQKSQHWSNNSLTSFPNTLRAMMYDFATLKLGGDGRCMDMESVIGFPIICPGHGPNFGRLPQPCHTSNVIGNTRKSFINHSTYDLWAFWFELRFRFAQGVVLCHQPSARLGCQPAESPQWTVCRRRARLRSRYLQSFSKVARGRDSMVQEVLKRRTTTRQLPDNYQTTTRQPPDNYQTIDKTQHFYQSVVKKKYICFFLKMK